jgi:putative glutamine transport system permease protein
VKVLLELQQLFQYENLRFLGKGLLVTLQVAGITIALSFFFGTLVGIARWSGHWLLRRLAGAYVEAIRNSPLILLILFAKFVTALPAMTAGIVAMTVFTTAILAEVVRAGLNSIDRGQWEAARSQGFTFGQTLRYVILPQAIRKVIPPIFSQFTTVVKDTSFVWVIGVEDLTGKGFVILGRYASTAQFFALFGAIGLTYFVLCWLLGRLATWIERRQSWLSY